MKNISAFQDGLRFAKKGSLLKLWHSGLLLGSYFISRIFKKNLHLGLPVSMSVEPTTACNLRCPECPSGLRSFSRSTGNMKLPFYKKLIDETRHHLWYLILYFQGEPFLNKHIFELIKYASKNGIYTATSTNGHFLNDASAKATVESGLDRLIISIDGTTQEVYASYRREGKLETVLDGARNIVKWKKELNSRTPFLIFQFLVVKPNEHQIEEVKELAKDIGVDEVAFKTAQIYDYQNGNKLIPENEKHSRYRKQNNGSYKLKNKLLNHCWKMWHSCVSTWDGNIVPCCFDKDAHHTMGNLNQQPFDVIWNSNKYQRFRKQLLTSRSQIDICKNCTEGTQIFT